VSGARKAAETNQIERFERWRRLIPKNTAYLVSLVLDEVVPLFQARDLSRFPDYAGGSSFAVGPNCIPLQRRSGAEWPTVEIMFHKRSAPSLGVNFAMLPERCHRYNLTEDSLKEIPRIEAGVVEGGALFSLCKGSGRNFDCNFGYRWWSFDSRRTLKKEIEILKLLLPELFDLFDRGIPSTWFDKPNGYVDRHVFMKQFSRTHQHPISLQKSPFG
jgi:hypothetical protein